MEDKKENRIFKMDDMSIDILQEMHDDIVELDKLIDLLDTFDNPILESYDDVNVKIRHCELFKMIKYLRELSDIKEEEYQETLDMYQGFSNTDIELGDIEPLNGMEDTD